MTYAENGFMPLNRQLFRRSMAEALSALLGQKYPTAKALHRGIGIDITTAENLRKKHLSVPTLEKALQAEGRDLWNRLGDELYGETFYQFEERRIETAMREAASVLGNITRLRSQSEKLLASAADMDAASVGGTTPAGRAEEGRSWGSADRSGNGTPTGARDRGAR